jgi:hypothetical protein
MAQFVLWQAVVLGETETRTHVRDTIDDARQREDSLQPRNTQNLPACLLVAIGAL